MVGRFPSHQKKKKALYIAENIGLKHSPRAMQTDLHNAFYLRSSKKGFSGLKLWLIIIINGNPGNEKFVMTSWRAFWPKVHFVCKNLLINYNALNNAHRIYSTWKRYTVKGRTRSLGQSFKGRSMVCSVFLFGNGVNPHRLFCLDGFAFQFNTKTDLFREKKPEQEG